MVRRVLRLFWGLLPASILKNRASRLVGYEVHVSASVGPIFVQSVDSMKIGEGCRIGPFNVLRDLRLIRLDGGARIGQWNWISAARPLWADGADGSGTFLLGEASSITSRHYIDASGGVTIGKFTTIAGVRSTIVTHGIDSIRGVQSIGSCKVGSFSIVSSNCKFTPGAHVPAYSIIGMGAVISKGLTESHVLYAGCPARKVRGLDATDKYFTRSVGRIPVP